MVRKRIIKDVKSWITKQMKELNTLLASVESVYLTIAKENDLSYNELMMLLMLNEDARLTQRRFVTGCILKVFGAHAAGRPHAPEISDAYGGRKQKDTSRQPIRHTAGCLGRRGDKTDRRKTLVGFGARADCSSRQPKNLQGDAATRWNRYTGEENQRGAQIKPLKKQDYSKAIRFAIRAK